MALCAGWLSAVSLLFEWWWLFPRSRVLWGFLFFVLFIVVVVVFDIYLFIFNLIIIMYIYHALVNAPSTHMIHINL